MKVQNIKDVNAFFKMIDTCDGTVELVTGEGDRLFAFVFRFDLNGIRVLLREILLQTEKTVEHFSRDSEFRHKAIAYIHIADDVFRNSPLHPLCSQLPRRSPGTGYPCFLLPDAPPGS